MSTLFVLTLGLLGFAMKLVALLVPVRSRETRWAFVLSPLVSPNSLKRCLSLTAMPRVFLRAGLFLGAVALYYWIHWKLVHAFDLHGIILSYLGVPALMLLGQPLVALITPLWLPAGRLLPPLHQNPLFARGIADFWGRRWNLWFSDWFRYAIFDRRRGQPARALVLVFLVSGLMHEWVVNVPLYWVTGRKLFGTMMLYFLLQAAGVLMEHRFLQRWATARVVFVWLVVLAPVPLLINEGLLRTLHLWPD